MKKCVVTILLLATVLSALSGCSKKITLHCDSCGKEVQTTEDSGMDEDWIIYCETCNEELFGDDPILGSGS